MPHDSSSDNVEYRAQGFIVEMGIEDEVAVEGEYSLVAEGVEIFEAEADYHGCWIYYVMSTPQN